MQNEAQQNGERQRNEDGASEIKYRNRGHCRDQSPPSSRVGRQAGTRGPYEPPFREHNPRGKRYVPARAAKQKTVHGRAMELSRQFGVCQRKATVAVQKWEIFSTTQSYSWL